MDIQVQNSRRSPLEVQQNFNRGIERLSNVIGPDLALVVANIGVILATALIPFVGEYIIDNAPTPNTKTLLAGVAFLGSVVYVVGAGCFFGGGAAVAMTVALVASTTIQRLYYINLAKMDDLDFLAKKADPKAE